MTIEANGMFPDIGNSSRDLVKANTIVGYAAFNQLDLVTGGRFDVLQGKTDSALMEAFSYDQKYLDLLRAARLGVGDFEDDHLFKRELAGALFEELALANLASRQDLGGVVLSGSSLFDVMIALNQGREIIEHGFERKSLYGRYIPDGLLIGEVDGKMAVQGVIEISLGKWREKLNRDNQIIGYQNLLKDLRIKHSRQSPLIIVTPGFEDSDDVYNGFGHIPIPVGRRDFLDGLFDFTYFMDNRLDGITLNQARQNFRRSGRAVANLASV